MKYKFLLVLQTNFTADSYTNFLTNSIELKFNNHFHWSFIIKNRPIFTFKKLIHLNDN